MKIRKNLHLFKTGFLKPNCSSRIKAVISLQGFQTLFHCSSRPTADPNLSPPTPIRNEAGLDR
ncbi:hypothetical protein V6Z12_D12G127300 [Gossypium hirsutum]